MQVTVKVLEIGRPLQLPTNLYNYDGVRLYYSLDDQIKGYITVWNKFLNRKPKPKYPDGSCLWPLLAESLFGPHPASPVERVLLQKLLLDYLKLEARPDPDPDPAPPAIEFELPPLSASIILPTKDRPTDLARALQHLTAHQTRVPYEIIVVDNHPQSGLTRPVVERFPGIIYVPEPRTGVDYARNRGVLLARGDIAVMTDDDIVVGEGWLDYLIAPFADPQVGAVMGLVLPYQINTRSQELFEAMGGLGQGFEARRYDQTFFNQERFPDPSQIGNGASAAFRFAMFADPNVGPFEDVLGSGTPTRGGGDTYHFYRVLAGGYDVVYEPRSRAFHKHRVSRYKLRKQLVNFECGYVAMLLRVATRDKDPRVRRVLLDYLPYGKRQELWQALQGRHPQPLDLVLARIWGNLIGPFNLWRSLRRTAKIGHFEAEQFGQRLTHRETIRLSN